MTLDQCRLLLQSLHFTVGCDSNDVSRGTQFPFMCASMWDGSCFHLEGEYVSPIFEATPMYESGLQSNYRLIYPMQHALRWVYVNLRTDVHQESRAIRQNVAPDVFASNPICHCTRLVAHIGTEASRKHNPVSAIFCQVDICGATWVIFSAWDCSVMLQTMINAKCRQEIARGPKGFLNN